jgi:hypothetical protein
VTIPELASLYSSGKCSDGTLVWKDGQAGWEALGSIPALIRAVKASLAPPGPPVPSRGGAPPVPMKPTAASPRMAVASPANGAMKFHASGRVLSAMSKASNWQEKLTADGTCYYWNASTETVTWDKPDCLKSEAEKEVSSGNWCWVKDPTEGFCPARVLKEGGGSVGPTQVQLQNGQKKTVKKGPDEPLWPLRMSSLNHIEDDLVMVDDINTGLMVYCLRERFRRNQIYTWVGANHSVLVSINPFKQLPIYGPSAIADYAKPSAYRLDPPHTYAIANSAYQRLNLESTSQAILISGESGAGKTEATKQCFNFLADVAGSANAVEQRILYANPVLEAFGNAKTLRNNNSSRFGRWTEVHFDSRTQICGARIENYLLEKQRVVNQARGERNFHIFYQLCLSEFSQMLQLGAPEHFRYLNTSGCTSVPGIKDPEDFQEVDGALDKLGFSLQEKCWCFETCAAVLHLGNISFAPSGEGSVVDPNGAGALHAAARLLQIDADILSKALTLRTIEVRGDRTMALNSVEQAYQAADALSKAAYDHMFDWLVGRINVSVSGQMSSQFIGVLDIFGFEIFEKNHFEQLCINYTNEKLQQHFNKHTFKEEESVYTNEQIKFEHIHFIDNQPVVDLIEKKPYGLMPLLDEEVKIPRGSDSAWLTKSKQHNEGHPSLANVGQNPNRFIVRHYAGEVIYDNAEFVVTNRDNLFRDLYDAMSSSASTITQAVFPPKDNNPRRATTLGEKFRKALGDLMLLVDQCEPWYIRCIKPNDKKAPMTFESTMCIEQLTYAGVFEAVAIRKTGYPFRLPHRRFASRYRCLAYKETGWMKITSTHASDHKGMCIALMGCVHQDFTKVQIGATMVLYRAEEHRVLELLRNLCLERVMPVIQRMARKKLGRKFRRYMLHAKEICRMALAQGASGDAASLRRTIAQAEEATAPVRACFAWEPYQMRHCRDLLFALEERAALYGVLQGLVNLDPMHCYGDLRAAVARCNKIRHIPGTAEQTALESRARALLNQATAQKLEPIAAEALAIVDKRMMEDIDKEAAAVEYDSQTIASIRQKLALPEAEFVQLQLEAARELNDPERVINREIKLKEMFLDANASAYPLDSLPLLRDAHEWAALKPLKTFKFGKKSKDELAATFLMYTTDPIHKSLLDMSGLKGEAVRQFKNLLGYCGDRKYQYPDALLREIVSSGILHEELRGELYVQVMKQLNNNPNPESCQRCWEVFKLLLQCFPPPKDAQNHVHAFVRANAPDESREKLKMAVHMSVYDDVKSSPPTDKEIQNILSTFFDREIIARYNIDEDVVSVKPAVQRVQRAGWGAAAAMASGSTSPATQAAPANLYANPAPQMPSAAPPALPPKPPSEPKARALYAYDPAGQEGMIALSQGQVITIKNRDGADWWMADVDGKQGWVPASYVEMI